MALVVQRLPNFWTPSLNMVFREGHPGRPSLLQSPCRAGCPSMQMRKCFFQATFQDDAKMRQCVLQRVPKLMWKCENAFFTDLQNSCENVKMLFSSNFPRWCENAKMLFSTSYKTHAKMWKCFFQATYKTNVKMRKCFLQATFQDDAKMRKCVFQEVPKLMRECENAFFNELPNSCENAKMGFFK